MNFNDLLRQCKSGELAPLYLLYGAEKYLHKEALTALKGSLDESTWLFNYTEISIAGEGLGAVLDIAEQYPIGSRRLVVARDFEKLADEDLETLKTYLKNPQPTTTLIFQTSELDKRRSVANLLLKGCVTVELSALKDRDALDWAANYLRRAGYQISTNSLGMLVKLTGTDLFTLRNELEKLMANLGRPGMISSQDIENLVVASREQSNFELGDALASREPKRTLRLLSQLLADRAEPIGLLNIVARVFRQMLLAKVLMQERLPANEIAKEIGMPPFIIGDFLTKARQWESDKLAQGLKRIAETDNSMKNSAVKPGLQLEYLICELLTN